MESTLLSVTSKAKSALEVTFTHLDAEDTYSVSLEENSTKIWRVSYMEDGTRKELVGRVAKITKYDQQGPVKEYRPGIVDLVLRTTSGYKVTFDTSDDFKAGSVTIDAKDIRSIKDVETVPCPDPGQVPKPIMVPADAFNFIQQIYPDKYMVLDHIPNRLITDKTVNASAMFSGCTMLKMVRPMNTRNMTSMSAMFAKCNNLEEIPMMDTSRVMSMGGMFNDCFSLRTIPTLDTRNVRTFSDMFNGCSNIINLPELNMTSALSAANMFKGCTSLEDVSFTKGTLKIGLDFSDCKLRQDVVLNIIKNLGTPVATKNHMTFDIIPADYIDNKDNYKYKFTVEEYEDYIKPAEAAGWIFEGIICDSNIPELILDFSNYMSKTYPNTYHDMAHVQLPNTSQGTDMSLMFADCYRLMTVPQELVTDSCLNMSGMFLNCQTLIMLPGMNTSKVINMSQFAYGCRELVAVAKMDTSKVTSMKQAFANCYKLNTVPEMDLSSLVDAKDMFFRCNALEQFNIKPLTLHTSLDLSNTALNKQSVLSVLDGCGDIQFGNEVNFTGVKAAKELTKDEYIAHVQPVLDKGWTIKGVKMPDAVEITNFSYYMRDTYPEDYMTMEVCPEIPDTSKAVYVTGMFEGCEAMLAPAQLSLPNVVNADRMFYGCISMVNFYDMPDTNKLVTARGMFYGCSRMIVSPKIDTTGVIDFRDFFNSCQMLTTVSDLDMTAAQYTEDMFYGCSSLKNLSIVPDTLHVSLDVSDTNLTKESLLNTILNLGDPVKGAMFIFHNVEAQNDFTEDDIITYIRPAIEKGWTIECDVPLPIERTDYSWYMRNTFPTVYTTMGIAPELDISKAKYTDHMYDGCSELTRIPGTLDMSNVIHAYGMFNDCFKLTEVTFAPASIKCSMNFSDVPLSKEKVLEVFDCLGEPVDSSAGVVFTNGIYNLTQEEYDNHVVPAIEKGWNVFGIYAPKELATDFTYYLQKTYPETYASINILNMLPDTSEGVNMNYMFAGGASLSMITATFDTSKANTMKGMFENCTSLVSAPQINTASCSDFTRMFYNCQNLIYIPLEMDLTNMTETTRTDIFGGCNKLQYLAIKPGTLACSLNLEDTALEKVAIINILKGLRTLPENTKKTIKFPATEFTVEEYDNVLTAQSKGWIIYGIGQETEPEQISDFTYYMQKTYPDTFTTIVECPNIDTTLANNMTSMFEGCISLTNVVPLNTKAVTSMRSMFSGCLNLASVPELDMANVADANLMFASCFNLTDVKFTAGSLNCSVDFSDTKLSTESIYNILDNLKAIDATQTLTFPDKTLTMEDYDAHVAPAINKGWRIIGLSRQARTNFNDYMRLYYPETYQTLSVVNDLESTSEAITMNGMFKGCVKLIVAPYMITNKVVDMREMFAGCTNLVGVQTLSMVNVDHAEGMFDGCYNLSTVAFTEGSLKVSVDFTDCPLTRQVVLNIIKSASKEPEVGATLRFAKTEVRAVEWDQYIVPAQEAGWTIDGISVYTSDPGGDEELPETGLKVYAADVITDSEHQFVTLEQIANMKAHVEDFEEHVDEFDEHEEFSKAEAQEQDEMYDTLQWQQIPSKE